MSISDRLDQIEARAETIVGLTLGDDNARDAYNLVEDAVPALVAAVRAVLDRHKPVQHRSGTTICNGCWGDDDGELAAVEHPCPTVRAIATALREGQ